MGEVFRARDTRLGREVAVKILPPGVLGDPSRRTRFENESKTLASLNHPNIVAVHDVGDGYLVEELVPGETLSKKGRVSPKAAAEIGAQIADGLAAAHRAGIVHRDLKPDNVMLTPEGRVKILDFGLARNAAPLGPNDATLTAASVDGAIMGTPGYMAPEQARGQSADHRADIFALGVVLYEMLSGQRAFPGETAADRLAACLHKDPPALPDDVPSDLRRLVEKCLEKEPGARWQSAADLSASLRWTGGSGVQPAAPRTVGIGWKAASAALLAATVGLGWFALRPREAADQPAQRVLTTGPYTTISPDGKLLARHAPDGIRVKDMSGSEEMLLPNTKGSVYRGGLCWSPDSKHLCYFGGGGLWRVGVDGTPPIRLADAPQGVGAAWSGGWVLFAPTPKAGIHRVPEKGGVAARLTSLDATRGDQEHLFPGFVPNSELIYYTVRLRNREESSVYVQQPRPDAHAKAIFKTRFQVLMVQANGSGYVIFASGNSAAIQPFDFRSLRETGSATVVETGRFSNGTGKANMAVSDTGVLLLAPGYAIERTLAWIGREGQKLEEIGEPLPSLFNLALSPRGEHAVVTAGDAVLVNAKNGERSALQLNPSVDSGYLPAWSPDAKRIAYGLSGVRPPAVVIVSADGTGAAERFPAGGWVWDWSGDGQYLLTEHVGEKTGQDLATIDLSVPPNQRKSTPFLATPAAEHHAKFSPDGKWIAYTSDTTGQDEVWVESYPLGKGKWKVSRDGGRKPRWRRDGAEMFYYSADERIMAVPLRPGASLDPGAPQEVARVPLTLAVGWPYDATPDGKRFLVIPEKRVAHYPLILNWPGLLRKD